MAEPAAKLSMEVHKKLRPRIAELIKIAGEQYLYAPRIPLLPGGIARAARRRISDTCDTTETWRGRGLLVSLVIWADVIAAQRKKMSEISIPKPLENALETFAKAGGSVSRDGVRKAVGGARSKLKHIDLESLLSIGGIVTGHGPTQNTSEASKRFYSAWCIEHELRTAIEGCGVRIRDAWHSGEEPVDEVHRLLQLLRWWWIPATKEVGREDGHRYGMIFEDGRMVAKIFEEWASTDRARAIAACGRKVLKQDGPKATEPQLITAVGGDILLASLIDRFVFGGMIASPTAFGDQSGGKRSKLAEAPSDEQEHGPAGQGLGDKYNLPRAQALRQAHKVAADYVVTPAQLDMALATATFCWNPPDDQPDYAFVWNHDEKTLDVDLAISPRPLGLVLHGLMQPEVNEMERRWRELALEALSQNLDHPLADQMGWLGRLGWVQCRGTNNMQILSNLGVGQ